MTFNGALWFEDIQRLSIQEISAGMEQKDY